MAKRHIRSERASRGEGALFLALRQRCRHRCWEREEDKIVSRKNTSRKKKHYLIKQIANFYQGREGGHSLSCRREGIRIPRCQAWPRHWQVEGLTRWHYSKLWRSSDSKHHGKRQTAPHREVGTLPYLWLGRLRSSGVSSLEAQAPGGDLQSAFPAASSQGAPGMP